MHAPASAACAGGVVAATGVGGVLLLDGNVLSAVAAALCATHELGCRGSMRQYVGDRLVWAA